MSDEHDGVGSAGAGPETGTENTADARARTAVATRPLRPTGKRSRRGAESDTDAVTEADADAKSVTKNGGKAKTAKKGYRPGGRNPFTYVWTFLQQVVAELRKVIWPNRKQMISYTTVVLFFLAFMVALIGGVDYGLARLVMLVFG